MRIQTTISSSNNQLLIPINDLPTLQTNVRMHLGLDNPAWDNDLLYVWQEGINEDTRRHCVKPFVEVLLSERATQAVADNFNFMPYVIDLGSTGRGMDWIVAFHFNAFIRPQEFAFMESRKLLKVNSDSATWRNWVTGRSFVIFDDELPLGKIVSVPAEGPPTPAQHGKVYFDGQTMELADRGMVIRVEVPNALSMLGVKDEPSTTVPKPTTIGIAEVRMTLVTPVGSELKAEAAVFKATIDRMRRRADNENSWQFKETSQGVTRWYFIPRNSGSFQARLPLDLSALCQALNIVVVTDADGTMLTAANKDGEEISLTRGLGAMLKSAWKSTADVAAGNL